MEYRVSPTQKTDVSFKLTAFVKEAFAAEMENRAYLTWGLHDLDITPPFRPRLRLFTSLLRPSYQVMQIVASHIPNVRSFRGSGHMDFPDGAK